MCFYIQFIYWTKMPVQKKLKIHKTFPTVIYNLNKSYFSLIILPFEYTHLEIKSIKAYVPQRSKNVFSTFNLYVSDFPPTIHTDIAFYANAPTTQHCTRREGRRDCKLGIFNTSPRRQYTNMNKQTARIFIEKRSGYIYSTT